MKEYRAALLGCGRIGYSFVSDRGELGVYTHAEAYARCARTRLVAVCDSDAKQLTACADAWNIEGRFSDARHLLAETGPDIVSICTPDHTHFDLAMTALAVPTTRAILLEKPLALTMDDAGILVSEARERGVILAVNYSRRYAATHQALRDELAAGDFGTIQAVTGFYTKGVIHNGTHWFDLARFLFGEVSAVQAFPSSVPDGTEPTLDVRLEFSSGLIASLAACDQEAFAIFEMDVVGRNRRIRITNGGHKLQCSQVGDSPRYAGYRELIETAGDEGGLRDLTLYAVEDLVGCLDSSLRSPRCSGDDALMALRIAHAALAASQSGERIVLNP